MTGAYLYHTRCENGCTDLATNCWTRNSRPNTRVKTAKTLCQVYLDLLCYQELLCQFLVPSQSHSYAIELVVYSCHLQTPNITRCHILPSVGDHTEEARVEAQSNGTD